MARRMLLPLLLGMMVGCAVAPSETTVVRPLPPVGPSTHKTLTIGMIMDNRFPFLRPNGQEPKSEQLKLPAHDPLASAKEIRIPVGEVRSVLAAAFKRSQRFQTIINPPAALVGDTLPLMLQKALETSDYLVVGEVNKFHIRNLGRNWRANITYPLDSTILAIPSALWYLLNGQKYFVLTGGVFPVDTAACELSLSLTLYAVESGNAITTFRLQETAMAPVAAFTIYGDIGRDEDDWVDVGRQLGAVALSNACNQAAQKVAEAILKLDAQIPAALSTTSSAETSVVAPAEQPGAPPAQDTAVGTVAGESDEHKGEGASLASEAQQAASTPVSEAPTPAGNTSTPANDRADVNTNPRQGERPTGRSSQQKE